MDLREILNHPPTSTAPGSHATPPASTPDQMSQNYSALDGQKQGEQPSNLPARTPINLAGRNATDARYMSKLNKQNTTLHPSSLSNYTKIDDKEAEASYAESSSNKDMPITPVILSQAPAPSVTASPNMDAMRITPSTTNISSLPELTMSPRTAATTPSLPTLEIPVHINACNYAPDDCELDSTPPRKIISHMFGRNKKQTLLIPEECWPIWCRKHYQRAKFRCEQDHRFGAVQMNLARSMIMRLADRNLCTTYKVILRPRELLRRRLANEKVPKDCPPLSKLRKMNPKPSRTLTRKAAELQPVPVDDRMLDWVERGVVTHLEVIDGVMKEIEQLNTKYVERWAGSHVVLQNWPDMEFIPVYTKDQEARLQELKKDAMRLKKEKQQQATTVMDLAQRHIQDTIEDSELIEKMDLND